MALNIFEELDLTSSGDNVDEGFLKCKNNWSDMDTELNNARDGEASLLAKIDTLAPTLGHFRRSQFTYVDGDTITVGGGSYDVNGTLAIIEEALTTTAHGGTGADWMYLYIDYSSLPTDNVLIQSDLIWSTTAPTWSHTKIGWYNGSDRCIFALPIAVTSDDIWQFGHQGNFVFCSPTWDSGVATETWADVSSALPIPAFSRMAKVSFTVSYSDSASYMQWRTKGMTNTTYATYTAVGATYGFNTMDVYTDSSQLIQQIVTDAITTSSIIPVGWYLPEGM